MRRFAALLVASIAAAPIAAFAEPTVPPPATEAHAGDAGLQIAVLAGGCFWGVQAVFQHVKGVSSAVSGYAGGEQKTADYETVSSGGTGHAESVRVIFDPKQVSYGKLLQIYFAVAHDPTQLNRQGPDTGTQYRSEIFPQNEAQAKTAKDYIAQLDAAQVFKKPIVTKTGTMNAAFFAAEAYHQDYLIRHPYQPYIVINDAPKVAQLKAQFTDVWRDRPVTVAQADKGQ
jgi:peptide-methionine (S)-S-oxide reductase